MARFRSRSDLPLHDMTGGNYWMPSVIEYLDGLDKLRLGGGMSPDLISAMNDGALRAKEQLQLAATLEVEASGNEVEVKVVNHTGHKLITGYPEGRRMWLNIKWYDDNGLVHEDGEYGLIGVSANGVEVRSILDLSGTNTRIWEVHMGMTKEWAGQLKTLGYAGSMPLSYDRKTGAVLDLDFLANGVETELETFHFALNNTVIEDNRIPPYGMSYDTAKQRNVLPVPANQYGVEVINGTPSVSTYENYDEVDLVVPAGAIRAEINLMYQPTSWEYIQFLNLANDGSNAFLGDQGDIMLDAWLKTGMADPFVMASASWPESGASCDTDPPVLTEAIADDKKITVNWLALADENVVGYSIYYDQAGKAQLVTDSTCLSGQCSYTDLDLTNGQEYCYKLTAQSESCESTFSNIRCATPQPPGHQQLAGVEALQSGKWITEGKGRNATRTFVLTAEFVQGDDIAFQAQIIDDAGLPVTGAKFDLGIAGAEPVSITSTSSDSSGMAEATWTTQRPNKKGAGGTATALM